MIPIDPRDNLKVPNRAPDFSTNHALYFWDEMVCIYRKGGHLSKLIMKDSKVYVRAEHGSDVYLGPGIQEAFTRYLIDGILLGGDDDLSEGCGFQLNHDGVK